STTWRHPHPLLKPACHATNDLPGRAVPSLSAPRAGPKIGMKAAHRNARPREDTMRHVNRMSAPILVGAMLLLAPALATGAEIKVVNANALTIAMKEIAGNFTKETGHQVVFTGVSPGQVDQRIKAGEVYDIVINAAASIEAYDKDGRLRAG